MLIRRTALVVLLCAVIVALMMPQPSLTNASIWKMEEGVSLTYTYARISTGSGGQESGEAVYKIISFNDATLVVEASGVNTTTYRIDYEGGVPTYSQYLEGLVYLPPPCLERSIKGDLNWTMQVKTGTLGRVANATASIQNLTGASDFKALNLTLELVGWNYGNLSMLYDLESGILVRELWVPEYGDIIVLELKYQSSAYVPSESPLKYLPSVATLAAPAVIAFAWLVQRRRFGNGAASLVGAVDQNSPGVGRRSRWEIASALLSAAVLTLSAFLPWALIAGQGLFLPNSLSLLFAPPAAARPEELVTVSLVAHAASIAAWLGLAMLLFLKGFLWRLVELGSGLAAMSSVWLLLSGGLTPFWGVILAVVGGAIAVVSSLARRSVAASPPASVDPGSA